MESKEHSRDVARELRAQGDCTVLVECRYSILRRLECLWWRATSYTLGNYSRVARPLSLGRKGSGSAQAAHRHYTRPFPSKRKQSGYARLRALPTPCTYIPS